MKAMKGILENLDTLVSKHKLLSKFKPVLNALDEALFGTAKVTALPHISDYLDIKRFMSMVIIALIPAVIASVYFWGLKILLMIVVSYMFGGMVEVAFAVFRKKEIHEGFLVTGLIFPMILPPTTPLWVVAVGVVFGVLFGKEMFGGTGRNIYNPAIVGRIFLTIAFPSMMSGSWQEPFTQGLGGFVSWGNVDAITSATPLGVFKNDKVIPSYLGLLLGGSTGCVGETFRIGLIFGGIFLAASRIADWRIPFAYLGTVGVFSAIASKFLPSHFAPPLFQFLSGGLLLGAFFMATDPVTSPFTKIGRWISGALLGILTVLIRAISGYVEGVMFSILLVNTFTPLIDTLVLQARYKKKAPAKK